MPSERSRRAEPTLTLPRRRLGAELRRLREGANLTLEVAGKRLGFPSSKISRIENGQISATPRDVERMLNAYGASEDRRRSLTRLAREARQRGWWEAYGDAVATLAGLEDQAKIIRSYEAQLIPGLLQTHDYAGATIRAIRPDLTSEQIQRRVELRMARQSLLERHDAPAINVIVDEAVFYRLVGGKLAMGSQLRRLSETMNISNLTLRVLPFSAGPHPGMGGAFTILRFRDPADSDLVYLEQSFSYSYVDDNAEIDLYKSSFDIISANSLSSAESHALIKELAKRYGA